VLASARWPGTVSVEERTRGFRFAFAPEFLDSPGAGPRSLTPQHLTHRRRPAPNSPGADLAGQTASRSPAKGGLHEKLSHEGHS
jgi:hypothetical protein